MQLIINNILISFHIQCTILFFLGKAELIQLNKARVLKPGADQATRSN